MKNCPACEQFRCLVLQVLEVLLYFNLCVMILAEEDSLCYAVIRSKQFSRVPGVRKGGLSGAGIFTCHGKLTLCMLHNFNMALFE